MDEALCNVKHKSIDEKFARHEKWLGEHEGKIDRLETSDATNTNEIKNLCKQLGGQTKAIWGLVSTIIIALIGFVIWYIQTLPR